MPLKKGADRYKEDLYPVHFLGAKTRFVAKSQRDAALRIWRWCCEPDGPKVPPEYCPVAKWYSGAPTMGRLYKNTVFRDGVFYVGLGVPDRRQARSPRV